MSMVKNGRDEVHFEGQKVSIYAAEEMDWPVREFCKVPIWFRGQKYYLRSKRRVEGQRPMLYELWPWPADLHEESPNAVTYNEAYVAERDREATSGRSRDWWHLALLPFYPLLGLCWSRFKNEVLCPIGFEPGAITKASLVVMFNLCVLEAVFVGWLRCGLMAGFSGRIDLVPWDWALMFLLGADSAIRLGQTLHLDVQEHWGFCEWLWPRRRAKS